MTNQITVKSAQLMSQQAAMTEHWPKLIEQITRTAQLGGTKYLYKFGTSVAHLHDLLTLLKNSGFSYRIRKRFWFFGSPVGIEVLWK